MVQRLACGPFKEVVVTPDKGLAAFLIIYTRLEWVGEGCNLLDQERSHGRRTCICRVVDHSDFIGAVCAEAVATKSKTTVNAKMFFIPDLLLALLVRMMTDCRCFRCCALATVRPWHLPENAKPASTGIEACTRRPPPPHVRRAIPTDGSRSLGS